MLPAGVLAWAEANPQLVGMLLRGATALGGYGVSKLMGSPEEKAMKQQLSAISRLQPSYLELLEKQMAGQPTASSRAISSQVQQQGRAAQQSLATSANRMGQGGTDIARANQARVLAAMTQGETQALGQAQLAAQQQVGQLTGQAQQTQALLAAQEGQDIRELTQHILEGAFDKDIQDLIQQTVDAAKGQMAGESVTNETQQVLSNLSPQMTNRPDIDIAPNFPGEPSDIQGAPQRQPIANQRTAAVPITPTQLSGHPIGRNIPPVAPSVTVTPTLPAHGGIAKRIEPTTARGLASRPWGVKFPVAREHKQQEDVERMQGVSQLPEMSLSTEDLPTSAEGSTLGLGLSNLQTNALGSILTASSTNNAVTNALQYISRLRLIYELTRATNLDLPQNELENANNAIKLLQTMPAKGVPIGGAQ